jgi:hypothetical protein
MSTYTLPDLLQHWTLGEMSTEQAVGHLLQNLLPLAQRLTEQAQILQRAEKRIHHLEQLLNSKA